MADLQAQLSQLEKAKAPLAEQLAVAARFANVTIDVDGDDEIVDAVPSPQRNFHGREQWTLRWLLKKLQSEDARREAAAWKLFKSIVQRTPGPSTAGILNERKVMGLLGRAVEEALSRVRGQTGLVEDSSDTVVGGTPISKSPSRKRKRSGEIVASSEPQGSKKTKRSGEAGAPRQTSAGADTDVNVAISIFEALHHLVSRIGDAKVLVGDGRDAAFFAEYMKSVIRGESEEDAKILGDWLELSGLISTSESIATRQEWLAPFIDIWNTRKESGSDNSIFPKYCLTPALKLYSLVSIPSQWKRDLEMLLTRNIIMPVKTAYLSSKNTEALQELIRGPVSENPEFAPKILDISIRCLQPGVSRRLRLEDEAWLQAVFEVLMDSISTDALAKGDTVNDMLQLFIQDKVAVEQALLTKIVNECGLPKDISGPKCIHGPLIASMIKLDPQVFVLSSEEDGSLLKDIFSKITVLSTIPIWPELADLYVDEIIVPIMAAFAKQRNLIAFFKEWYSQLEQFEELRAKAKYDIPHFSAWEDEALHAKLKEVMEASLTERQIIDIADFVGLLMWGERPGPIFVLADAFTGAIKKEQNMLADNIAVRIFKRAIKYSRDDNVPRHYRYHIPRVMTHTFDYLQTEDYEVFGKNKSSKLVFVDKHGQKMIDDFDTNQDLRLLEDIRQRGVVMTTFSHTAFPKQEDVNDIASAILLGLGACLKGVIKGLASGADLGDEVWGKRITSIHRGLGWFACEYATMLFCEYSEFLLMLKPEPIAEILKDMFWIASATTPHSREHSSNKWLRNNCDVFPNIWHNILVQDLLQSYNAFPLQRLIIKTILQGGTFDENPIERSRCCNAFAIGCLNSIPVEFYTKEERVQILQTWPPAAPEPSINDKGSLLYRCGNLDTAVISLKMKMMRLPTLYQGMGFDYLVNLADAISCLSPEPKAPLNACVELARRSLRHVMDTLGQERSNEFIREAVNTITESAKESTSSKNPIVAGKCELADVTISVVSGHVDRLTELGILEKDQWYELLEYYRQTLLAGLKTLLKKPAKFEKESENGVRSMSLYCTLRALENPLLEFKDGELWKLRDISATCAKALALKHKMLAAQLETFFIIHTDTTPEVTAEMWGTASTDTRPGRAAIKKLASSYVACMDEEKRRTLAVNILRESVVGEKSLESLLLASMILEKCQDIPHHEDDIEISLCTAYTLLATIAGRTSDIRVFWLTTETLTNMLRNKPKSLTQHNVELTISLITHILSPECEPFPPIHRSSIYTHLTTLLTATLLTHRLNLSDRTHLLNQVLLALLEPLFTPLKNNRTHSLPIWVVATTMPPTPPLGVPHATAFAKLLQIICDPSMSAVSRKADNALVSATAKAKRIAAAHMPAIIAAFVRWTLDFGVRMDAEVREKLVPGWWAIFDVMSVEERKLLGEEMDRSGRDVLMGLVREWMRFGKWKGN